MPIFEFDEFENSRTHAETGELLMNYWGYSTVGFFAPKAGYAATGKLGMQVDELKGLVKELHQNGIEVFLDVVFNHTAEGNERGPSISFRGLDNRTYYMLTPEGYYYNFSGTGNTLNCNNPVVRNLVLDCLRYWAAEYHIDGFRFDLAAILGPRPVGRAAAQSAAARVARLRPDSGQVQADRRGVGRGRPVPGRLASPPTAAGREWNGKYRDTVRRFLKGDDGHGRRHGPAPDGLARPLLRPRHRRVASTSSPATTASRWPTWSPTTTSTTRPTARTTSDGANDNNSWNCGVEGATDDPAISQLRRRQIKNAIAMLHGQPGRADDPDRATRWAARSTATTTPTATTPS